MVILADFHKVGIFPVLRDKLNKWASGIESSFAQVRKTRAGKLSTPGALSTLILLRIPSSSGTVVVTSNNKFRLTTSVANSLTSVVTLEL